MRKRLTQKQETFCLKYFELGNASEAARLALYSPKTAGVIGAENLLKPKIQDRLKELRQAAEDASVASVLERKQILTDILRVTPADVLVISEDGRDTQIKPDALNSPAVSYIRTEQVALGKMPVRVTRVGLIDKVRAATELNKMEKIYTEGPTVNIDNRKIEIYVSSDKARNLMERITQGERTGENSSD